MFSKSIPSVILIMILLVFIKFNYKGNHQDFLLSSNIQNNKIFDKTIELNSVVVGKPVTIENYFEFLDSIVTAYHARTSYKLTEHLLVRANPWIIENLKNTDYYILKANDSFVYDQKKMIVFRKGDLIVFPDSIKAKEILKAFEKTYIDINIPEYKLRIIEDSTELYKFPIRVGRPEWKYLKMADRITDLKTKTGSGYIINHVRNPDYYNPVNGRQYFVTRRDDHKITALPQIPFLETEINGIRNGQLIHPTTNPITLEKAYSNGCIGTKETDAWVIYYYAPIGTKITIRYDLNIKDSLGEKIVLKDIYNYRKNL
ncbi:L,D-transpeptidase [Gaetbulibacter aquiaggeris]|uniref:L,D-transpeptidase n=1 Tax=Gaetbulibacter aquiaggeris TaxID=1735373 RepID=A0ABW7MV84_9FLAO